MLIELKGKDNFYRIRGLSASGNTEYDFIATTKTKGFEIKKPYQFMPDCSRLGVTIIQDSRKIKLAHYKDFQAFIGKSEAPFVRKKRNFREANKFFF